MKSHDGLYALYLRRSRADIEKEQYGEFETLAKHESELTEFAKHHGYILDQPYFREIVSGEHIAERLEFQRLMQKVEAGEYRGILVHSVSRLGRGDPMEYGWTLFVLRAAHCVIVTPTKTYDPNNQDDARYLQMEMFVSNMELGNIRSRMVSGMLASAKAGCFIKPTPPFGYDRIKRDGKWTLKPNEDASTVKLIFDRAASGIQHGTIARELNREKILTARGKQWSAQRILSILKNPHYKGMIRYGYYKNEQVPGEGFEMKRKQTFSEDCILVPGLHEAIVADEIWQAANDNIAPSPRIPGNRNIQNPLAGLLYCAKCGKAMKRFKNKCPSNGHVIEHLRHQDFCDCHMRGANLDLVVGYVADALADIADDMELKYEAPDTTKDELASVETALKREESRLDKLIELYFNDAINLEEFKERRQQSEEKVATLNEKLVELTRSHKSPKEIVFSLRHAIKLLKDKDVSAAAKNQALKAIVKRIEFDNHTKSRKDPDIRLKVELRD